MPDDFHKEHDLKDMSDAIASEEIRAPVLVVDLERGEEPGVDEPEEDLLGGVTAA